MRMLCEHLDPLKPRQVEFKARIIATSFAVNSTCQAISDTKYVAGNAKNSKQTKKKNVCVFILFVFMNMEDWGPFGGI